MDIVGCRRAGHSGLLSTAMLPERPDSLPVMASSIRHRATAAGYRVGGEWVRRAWAFVGRVGAIGPDSAAGRRWVSDAVFSRFANSADR